MIKKITISFTLLVMALILPSAAFAATLSLNPATGTFNKGCSYSVQILLDANDVESDGTDAIVTYDPANFTVTGITSGSIYPDYPGNDYSTPGRVTVSGLASVSTPFKGAGTLATINFTIPQTAPGGTATMKFDFAKDRTTDSNVVERGTIADKLNSVTDGSYTIGTGACTGAVATSAPKPPSGSGSATITPRGAASITPTVSVIPTKTPVLVDTGLEGPTLILSVVGGVLIVAGIIGLAIF